MKHFSHGKVGRDGKGERVFKSFTVRIFRPENKSSEVKRHLAPPGHHCTLAQIETVLDETADLIERFYPGEDYQMVQVGKAEFNFVWRSKAEAAAIESAAA